MSPGLATKAEPSEEIVRMSLLPLLSTMLIATYGGPAQEVLALLEPPAWVVDGVPDTVWILVEATLRRT